MAEAMEAPPTEQGAPEPAVMETYGGFGGFGGFGGYGNTGGSQSSSGTGWSEEDVRMQAAENYIRNHAYDEALHVLSELSNRNARWYYLSAMANSGQGNNITAKEHAQRAVSMEPNNMLYRQLLQQLENGGQWYQTMGQEYGNPFEGSGDWCMKLCLLNAFCSCWLWWPGDADFLLLEKNLIKKTKIEMPGSNTF